MSKFQFLVFFLFMSLSITAFSDDSNNSSYKIVGKIHVQDGHFSIDVLDRTYEKLSFKIDESSFSHGQKSLFYTVAALVGKEAEIQAKLITPVKYRKATLQISSISPIAPKLLLASHGEGIWKN